MYVLIVAAKNVKTNIFIVQYFIDIWFYATSALHQPMCQTVTWWPLLSVRCHSKSDWHVTCLNQIIEVTSLQDQSSDWNHSSTDDGLKLLQFNWGQVSVFQRQPAICNTSTINLKSTNCSTTHALQIRQQFYDFTTELYVYKSLYHFAQVCAV